MASAILPDHPPPPATGWLFHGPWTETDRHLITQTLSERVLHRGQAQADPWLFVAHKGDYYAHCPTFHAPEYGYCEHDAAELADALWGHYFTRSSDRPTT
jgi:hypothetical protein